MTDDAAKTKAELIEELHALRKRLAPQAAEDGKTEGTAEHAPVEGGAFFLHDRLRTLLEVTYELSQVSSFNDFCRQAVALGRDRLGFARLGIWFFDEADPQFIVGSYGIDEEGHVRDERHRRHPSRLPAKTIRNGAGLQALQEQGPLYDHQGNKVAECGSKLIVPIADGRNVVGVIHADDLLTGRSFSEEDRNLLVLYGSALGHLCSRKHTEEALRHSEEEDRRFQDRLRILFEVRNELSGIESFDLLCRRAVELGRERLGFDRLGIWFVDEDDPDSIVGSFGTDTEGRIRDERRWRQRCPHLAKLVRDTSGLDVVHRIAPLLDEQRVVLRQGEIAFAAVGQGPNVMGFISSDNLLRRRRFTPQDKELLVLYGSALGSICGRQRAFQALEESEEKFRQLAETTDAVFWMRSQRTNELIYVSPACERVFGLSVETILECPDAYFQLIHPEDMEMLASWVRYLRSGEDPGKYDVEYRIVRPDGEVRWIRDTSFAIRDNKGQVYRRGGLSQDVTDRKRAEARITQYGKMLESTLIATWEATAAEGELGICRRAVEAVRSHLGFDRAGVWLMHEAGQVTGTYGTDGKGQTIPESDLTRAVAPGSPFAAIMSGQEKWRIIGQPAAKWAGPSPEEIAQPSHYGLVGLQTPERIIGAVSVDNVLTNRPILKDQMACLGLFAQNVANALASARLGTHLRRAQRMESIGTLASGVAHNFNNLLGIILGSAELLNIRIGKDSPADAHVQEIIKATDRAALLAKQLLSVARQGSRDREPVSVVALVGEVVKTLCIMFPSNVEIVWRPPRKDHSLLVSRSDIEQVLMNICLNARDAMPKGGRITITSTAVELSRSFYDAHENMRPGRHVCIAIRDVGIGMDEATLARIFDPFFTTKEPGQGTGLGLAMAYGTIVSHGGCIDVESEPDKGSTFRVYLPVATGPPTQTPQRETAKQEHGSETILLVDDEDAIIVLCRSALERLGYTILTAANGEEAVHVYKQERDRIALVVLDYMMPKMDGEDTFIELKEIDPNVKVIIASGYHDSEYIERILEAGALRLIRKPYHLADLTQAVRETLKGT